MMQAALANENLNRHQESLALRLERLTFLRRILPESHLQIGLFCDSDLVVGPVFGHVLSLQVKRCLTSETSSVFSTKTRTL